jgi:anti-sigma regulatory factor (Ser/Thr protein kinase)
MNSGNPITAVLTMAGDAAAVGVALAGAQQFSVAAGLAPTPSRRLAIIVEELVANLRDHAGLGAADTIEMHLSHDADGTILVLTDPAAPFDPRLAPAPTGLPPESGGGAGLALVRAFAASIDYDHIAGRNRLTVHIAG